MAIERFRTVEEPRFNEESGLRVSDDAVRRPAAAFDDPLAELARIIGGDDPYRRDLQRAVRDERYEPAPRPVEPSLVAAHHDAGWEDLEAELASFSAQQQPAPAVEKPVLELDMRWLRHEEPQARAAEEPLYFDPPVYSEPAPPEAVRQPQAYAEPAAEVPAPVQDAYAAFEASRENWRSARTPEAATKPGFTEPTYAGAYAEPSYAEPVYAPEDKGTWSPEHEVQAYEPLPLYPADPSDAPVAYAGAGGADEQAYETYETMPRRRSGGLLTIGVVIALTALGGAGYASYRVLKGGASSGQVNVIKADAEPAKIAGPAAVENAKRVQDRVPSGPDQVVSREEKPLSLREQSAQIQAPPVPQGPRVISLSTNNDADSVPDTNAAKLAPAVAPVPSALAPVAAAPTPVIPPLPPLPAGVTVASPGQSSSAPATPSPVSRPAAADEPRRVKTVSIGPDGRERNAPVASSPSLLAPPPAAPAAAQKKLAAAPSNAPIQLAPPAVASSRPVAPSAPVASSGGDGDFMLQLASDKTEEGARSAYSGLKRKYSALGPYGASYKSVDLGEKGTFVRARIGPFSRETADRVCGELRAQGGACLIQRR